MVIDINNINYFFYSTGTDIDECLDHVCENGATCVDGVAQYTCTCVAGFTAEFCQTSEKFELLLFLFIYYCSVDFSYCTLFMVILQTMMFNFILCNEN